MASRVAGAAAAVCVLALAGCAAAPAAAPEVSDAEAAVVAVRLVENYWEQSFLGEDVPFPDVTAVRLVTTSDWSTAQVVCLVAAGLPAREVSGGFTVDGDGALTPLESETAQATCLAQYPVDPRLTGYLSAEQMAYAYDYLTARIVPCLSLLGYPVPEVPERQSFVGDYRLGVPWTPYQRLDGLTDAEWGVIDNRCPPLPAESYGAFQPPEH